MATLSLDLAPAPPGTAARRAADGPGMTARRTADGRAVGTATLRARPSLLDRLLDERRRETGPVDERHNDQRDQREQPAPADPAPRVPAAGDRSLDDLVSATWHAVTSSEAAACVVCGGELAPRYGAGPRPVAARCRSCGTELS